MLWRWRRLRWRLRLWRLITRWPFSIWIARWPRNHHGVGGGGDDGGGGGDHTWATRTPAPVRGVVLPEIGGASDKPVSWRRRLAVELVPAPIVEPLRLMQSAGPVAEPRVESTRLSLPSAVLAFPSGCENETQNCKQFLILIVKKMSVNI